jgi:hypothetical protein
MKKIARRHSVFESTVLKYFGVRILVPFHKLDTNYVMEIPGISAHITKLIILLLYTSLLYVVSFKIYKASHKIGVTLILSLC